MKRRILIAIEYNGGGYCGWQAQNNGVSMQGVIAEALEKVCGHKIKLVGSGRTDAGVHAMAQYAHFDCYNDSIPEDKFPQCLNPLLPRDIKVFDSKAVADDFHARFDARKKIYLYKIYSAAATSPLREGLFAYTPFNLNLNKMRKACQYLSGRHDFSAFCASGSEVKDCIREIYYAKISRKRFDNCKEYYFEICGSGFLRNMVRIIAGTLIEAGRGKIKPQYMGEIIEGKQRSDAGFTAPPCGLYLKDVIY